MKKKVLIIDDDIFIRKAIRKVLVAENYVCLEAEDGVIGLQLILAEKPGVVVLDVNMLRMNGLQLLEKLNLRESQLAGDNLDGTGQDKRDGDSYKPLIIMLTGDSDPRTTVQSLRLGVFTCITKPIKRILVANAVEKAYEQVDMLEEIQLNKRYANAFEQMQGIEHMAAGFAHQINQPLQSIANYNTLISLIWQDAEVENDALNIAYEKIKASQLEQQHLLKAIQSFTQAPNKTMARGVEINRAVTESLVMLRRTMTDQGVTLTLDLAEDLPYVRGNFLQLQQLSINVVVLGIQVLASNYGLAIGTAFDRGNVSITWHFRVEQPASGAAIKADTINVFDWDRGSAQDICQLIARDHGGSWDVYLQERETRFTLNIPVC